MNEMREITKAVIPCAGMGTRTFPLSLYGPKELIEFEGKPALMINLAQLHEAGIKEVIIVASAEKVPVFEHLLTYPLASIQRLEDEGKLDKADGYVDDIAFLKDLDIQIIEDPDPRGLGASIAVAREAVDYEPFLVVLPDNIFSDSTMMRGLIEAYKQCGMTSISLATVEVDEVSSYGIARVDAIHANGIEPGKAIRLHGLVEKPAVGAHPSRLAVMGAYAVSPEVFNALNRVEPGAGGEIQFTDALAQLNCWGVGMTGTYVDLGTMEGIRAARAETNSFAFVNEL